MILKNITYIDFESLEFYENINILVEKGINGSIKFLENITDTNEEIIDCTGLYAIKSFVQAHHHAYSALALGMPMPQKKPNNFLEILKYIWWNLDSKLDKSEIEASALVTAMNCAKNGVTFVIDHHSSPNFISGSLDIIAKAFEKIGLSHLLCYEITDRNGKQKSQEALEETKNYLNRNQGLVGLHASFTVDNDTLAKAAEIAEEYKTGIHIHVAEDPIDEFLTYEHYGMTVIERLQNFGLIQNSKTILAHCLHINEKERYLLDSSNCYIVLNTESNLNNQVGTFDATDLDPNRILIGTDGMHSNMIKAAQYTYFNLKNNNDITIKDVYQYLINNNKYLETNNFKGNNLNNLIIFDYPATTPLSKENFLGHFFYGFENSFIKHVISQGEFIVKNQKLTKINEEEILTFSRQQAIKLWEKL